MQISGATAQDMGLRMIYTTRYRTTTERKPVKNKRGKTGLHHGEAEDPLPGAVAG